MSYNNNKLLANKRNYSNFSNSNESSSVKLINAITGTNKKETTTMLVSTSTNSFTFKQIQPTLISLLNKENALTYKLIELPNDLTQDP